MPTDELWWRSYTSTEVVLYLSDSHVRLWKDPLKYVDYLPFSCGFPSNGEFLDWRKNEDLCRSGMALRYLFSSARESSSSERRRTASLFFFSDMVYFWRTTKFLSISSIYHGYELSSSKQLSTIAPLDHCAKDLLCRWVFNGKEHSILSRRPAHTMNTNLFNASDRERMGMFTKFVRSGADRWTIQCVWSLLG